MAHDGCFKYGYVSIPSAERKRGPFLFTAVPQRCTPQCCLHFVAQNLATWPYLAAREAEKCLLSSRWLHATIKPRDCITQMERGNAHEVWKLHEAVSALRLGDGGGRVVSWKQYLWVGICVWSLTTALLLTLRVTLAGHFTWLSLSPVIFKGQVYRTWWCLRSLAPQTCYVSDPPESGLSKQDKNNSWF